jgi:pre-mRNA-processing factor SLU7
MCRAVPHSVVILTLPDGTLDTRYLPNLEDKINFEGKRDRWRGYNPAEYQRVVERYDKIEEEKLKQREKQLREEKFQQGTDAVDNGEAGGAAKAVEHDSDSSSEDGDDEDDAKYAESSNMIQKFDAKNRVSVRNLRIREDTAKYVLLFCCCCCCWSW